MGIEQARLVLIVICSVVSLALALNFFFFFKKPVSKGVAVLITVGLCVILVVIKSLLKQNNSDFGGLFAYPILFYFLLKKKEKQKESLNQIDSPAKEELEPTSLTQIKTLSCISCGTENQTEALFCQKCGNSLSGVTAQLKPIVKLQETRPAIWNPNSTALWSLVLSPAFGSFLLMLNWRALGEPEKAVSARNWYFASLVMFTINVFIVAAGINIDAGVLEI